MEQKPDQRLLARTVWNRLGCRAGGITVDAVNAFWKVIRGLTPSQQAELQGVCRSGADRDALYRWLHDRGATYAAFKSVCADIIIARSRVQVVEANGFPIDYSVIEEDAASTATEASAADGASSDGSLSEGSASVGSLS